MDYIKIFAYLITRLCMRLLCIFPIKRDRLLFESYKGKSYSCNPKYICEFLLKNYSGLYEIVWVLESPDRVALPKGITTVKKRSFANFFYHMTAKVIIANMADDVYIPKRKNQIFINTWHGGGAYKKVGLSFDKTHSKLRDWQGKIVQQETSYYVSSSTLFTKYNIKEGYRYEGEVVTSGMPRNDLFFDTQKMKSIKNKVINLFGLSEKLVVLYAPTFRGIQHFGKAASMEFVFPFREIINTFHEQGKNLLILNRSHHSVSDDIKTDMDSVIDVTDYPDMQELLVAADILITDYSSSIWDFSLTGKPCILYVPDKDEYLSDRGTYTPMDVWPGLMAATKDELIQLLLDPDYELCKQKADASLKYFNSYENGNATKSICNLINEVCAYES